MVTFENLQVDQYVDDILKSTPKTVDQVMIEPNGNWYQTLGTDVTSGKTNGKAQSSSGDDDLIEIQDLPEIAKVKREATADGSFLKTPPMNSMEQPNSSGLLPPPGSNKRSSGAVVDLTLSSDEDEEPVRPAKRHLSHRPSNILPSLAGSDNAPPVNGLALNGYPPNSLPPMPMDYGTQPWDPL